MRQSVLERYASFRLVETTEEEGGVSVEDIRGGFKGARWGVKQKYTETSPNAVRAAVKSVFGLDCDKDDMYQNLKFRSLRSHAADCDVLAVMPHNGLQDTSFARGFNLQVRHFPAAGLLCS